MIQLNEKVKEMFPQVQQVGDTAYAEYFCNLVVQNVSKKFPELSAATISKKMVEKVLVEIKEDNLQQMKNLNKEYEQGKGLNKYVDDGIWMDIGGLATVNETIDELLAS